MSLSPIVLFVYNRPEHTKKTLKALQENILASDSELFIYSDASKDESSVVKVNEVRTLIANVTGFKNVTVTEQETNQGLANSIINGVTEVVNKYGRIIVLEDDLVTSSYFLTFMNDALEAYQDELKVVSIHGYIYPIEGLPSTFFIKGADCWGWATWKNAWDVFERDGVKLLKELESAGLEATADFNNSYGYTKMLKDQIHDKNDSWAIRWYMSAFLKNMLTLYPGCSLVKNIGNDNSGTHSGRTSELDVNLSYSYEFKKIEAEEDTHSRKKMELYFKSLNLSVIKKLYMKIISVFA